MGRKRNITKQQTLDKKFKPNNINTTTSNANTSINNNKMETEDINQQPHLTNSEITGTSKSSNNITPIILNSNNTKKTINNDDIKIPPIIIENKNNININEFINETKKIDFNIKFKFNNNKISIYTTNIDKHSKIINYLKNKNLEFHTYAVKSLKSKKYVIKGLHRMPVEDLLDFFKSKNITTEKITTMKQTHDTNFPFYYVAVSNDTSEDEVKKIRYINNISVTIEKYQNKTQITQCYNCQNFGHGSSTCNFKPACVKCAGNHETKTCTKAKEEKPTCANCKGDHPANYSGCIARTNYKNYIANKHQNNAIIRNNNNYEYNELLFPNITNHPKQDII